MQNFRNKVFYEQFNICYFFKLIMFAPAMGLPLSHNRFETLIKNRSKKFKAQQHFARRSKC